MRCLIKENTQSTSVLRSPIRAAISSGIRAWNHDASGTVFVYFSVRIQRRQDSFSSQQRLQPPGLVTLGLGQRVCAEQRDLPLLVTRNLE